MSSSTGAGHVGSAVHDTGFLGDSPGLAAGGIGELMVMFSNRAYYQAHNDKQGLNDLVNQMGGAANVDNLWHELLRLLEEEITAVRAAFEEEMKAQEEKDAIERDACLAPAGETWEMLLRQEAALDRSIDRKVRIILTLRQEHARRGGGGSRTALAREPDGTAQEVAPNFSSAGAPTGRGATNHGSESPVEEIGIGAAVTRRPLPHHRAYGSVHGGSSWLR